MLAELQKEGVSGLIWQKNGRPIGMKGAIF